MGDKLVIACGQNQGLYALTTAWAKYLTSQVFFVRRFLTSKTLFTSCFNQAKTANFHLLNNNLYPLSPALMVTTK